MENFIFCAVRRPEEDFFESLINEHSIYVSYPKEYSFKVCLSIEFGNTQILVKLGVYSFYSNLIV